MSERRQFTPEFKKETVRLITELGQSSKQVAKDIGVHENTIYKWVQSYHEDPAEPFVGSGHQKVADEEMHRAKKRIADLEEEVAILKKAIAIFTKPSK
jgi:transposase